MEPDTTSFKMLKGEKRFADLTVEDARVVDKADLITVKDTDLLFDVLKTLAKKTLTGAPVVSNGENGVLFVGFVDLLDIASYVSKKQSKDANANVNVPLSEFMRGPYGFIFLKRSTLISEAVTHMAIHRVHRMAILEDDDNGPTTLPVAFSRVSSIITQADIFSLMVSYTYSVPEGWSFDKSISDLKIDIPKVMTVNVLAKASEAFTNMQESGYSALGVVDANGKLVNYIGVSHLRAVTAANLSDLHLTVENFLKHRQAQFTSYPLTATLKEVMSALKSNRYHRVFFVDSRGYPAGIMTLRDFLYKVIISLHLLD